MNISLNRTINFFFWVFTISVAFILTLPTLIQDGMFMDGVLYSAVSHNLANGVGSFWFPSFSYNNLAGIANSFHEQPPLIFGIQALFYKVFGHSMYVERFYIFLCLIINILLIKKLWELIFIADKHTKALSWLPVLFWISMPVCFWSFSNNMHENTVSIFILTAIIFIYKTISQKKSYLFLLPAALFIFLAALSKGLPGLFPIAVPLVFIYKDQLPVKKAILYSLLLLLTVLILFGLILLNKEAQGSLYNYFVLRLIKRVNDVPTTTNYFDTLFRLILESGIMIAIVLVVKFATRRSSFQRTDHATKELTFIMIGLLGILPLMLTLVQKGFYMVPALPYITIGFSILIAPQVNTLVTKLQQSKMLNLLKISFMALGVLAIVLPLLNIGKYSRDKEKLQDVHQLVELLKNEGKVIDCSPDLLQDWSLQTYLVRYGMISLDINTNHKFFLQNKQSPMEPIDTLTYAPFYNKLNNYVLWWNKPLIQDDIFNDNDFKLNNMH